MRLLTLTEPGIVWRVCVARADSSGGAVLVLHRIPVNGAWCVCTRCCLVWQRPIRCDCVRTIEWLRVKANGYLQICCVDNKYGASPVLTIFVC